MNLVTRPSSAPRWARCVGAPVLEAHLLESGQIQEEKSSSFAIEGTVAHALAAACILEKFDPMQLPDDVETACIFFEGDYLETELLADEEIKPEHLAIDDEMREAIKFYVDYIASLNLDGGAVEEKVDTIGGLGTSDLLGVKGHTLHVVDLKYGKGIPVSAEENEQLILYADGGLAVFPDHDIRFICLHIVQPRTGTEPSTWSCSRGELGERMIELQQKLVHMQGLTPGDELTPGDKQCRWCSAKPLCPALLKKTQEVAKADFADIPVAPESPAALTRAQLLNVLEHKEVIEKWLKAVQMYALEIAQRGEKLEGWKMVNGRKGRKKWLPEHEERVRNMCRRKKLSLDQCAPRTLISPTQLMKLMKDAGVKAPRTLPKYYEQAEGKLTLVREKHHAEAIAAKTAAEDFKDVEVDE